MAKTTEIVSQFWRLEVQNQIKVQGCSLLRTVRKNLFHASLQDSSGLKGIFHAPWFVNALPKWLPLSSDGIIPMFWLCVQISPFYRDNNHIIWGGHPNELI